ncbi:uncharacterized protein LOC100903633 [Galendromus occidentalis]|uniref:Uncharacterized protein LOC100903633 n=1 Tax=Galendromus occidentalis TaxID=34638 RepID=A0AAJ6QMY4_9ACAR|nr:uncharacterized protein LOC100903633 [Galendromus occidentalis]
MYSILVKLPDGKAAPLIYSLLPTKRADTYRLFIGIVVDALGGYQPEILHVDFEIAMVRELEACFPLARVLGCNLHFKQCLWRHIQADSMLRDKYLRDDDFALDVRMFAAIAFVPEHDVRSAFDTLLESNSIRENNYLLTSFINYFEATWIGRPRNPATMKIGWWNAHEATVSAVGRTNNAIEGWHSAFNGRLGATNPTFFKLVEQLKIEQGLTEFVIANSLAQGPGAPAKRIYRDRQKRLFEITSSYGNSSVLNFLRAIAHNISF